jgi:histidinol-phosphate aminotransferase
MTTAMNRRPVALRSAYRAIPLYASGDGTRPEIDLSDNTNQWGAPPAALRALAAMQPAAASRYPRAYSPELSAAIAKYAGVEPENVVTGAGSDQIIDCAFRALAEPGEWVAHLDPSFVIIPSFARVNSLDPVSVGWVRSGSPDEPELSVDPDAVLATRARIIYLCSPNNPTGTVIAPEAIEYIVARASGIVIVDEAYAEFSNWSAVSLLESAPHLIVTRTFSKAFGLAGLRVGYALGSPEVIRECAKARGPFAIGGLAEAAATAALTHDVEWMRRHAALAADARDRFTVEVRALGGYRVYSSGGNFVLIEPDRLRRPSAADIGRRFKERGIAVRVFEKLAGIGGAVRITVAPWDIMERCLTTLAEMKTP